MASQRQLVLLIDRAHTLREAPNPFVFFVIFTFLRLPAVASEHFTEHKPPAGWYASAVEARVETFSSDVPLFVSIESSQKSDLKQRRSRLSSKRKKMR